MKRSSERGSTSRKPQKKKGGAWPRGSARSQGVSVALGDASAAWTRRKKRASAGELNQLIVEQKADRFPTRPERIPTRYLTARNRRRRNSAASKEARELDAVAKETQRLALQPHQHPSLRKLHRPAPGTGAAQQLQVGVCGIDATVLDKAAEAARQRVRIETRDAFPEVHETPLLKWERLSEADRHAWRMAVIDALGVIEAAPPPPDPRPFDDAIPL
jgi:hypothetical protein